MESSQLDDDDEDDDDDDSRKPMKVPSFVHPTDIESALGDISLSASRSSVSQESETTRETGVSDQDSMTTFSKFADGASMGTTTLAGDDDDSSGDNNIKMMQDTFFDTAVFFGLKKEKPTPEDDDLSQITPVNFGYFGSALKDSALSVFAPSVKKKKSQGHAN